MISYALYFKNNINTYAKWIIIYLMEMGFLFVTLLILAEWQPSAKTVLPLILIGILIAVCYAYIEESQVVMIR